MPKPKRSPRYDPARHGTGWDFPRDNPTNRAVDFLENDMVSPEQKAAYITSMGATPPDSLPTATVTPVDDEDQTIEEIVDEEPTELQGRTTTHFMINWAGTGFEYRLQRRLSDSVQIEAIRREWIENQQIGS